MAQRKRKSPEERGYLPIEEVTAGLRALAVQLEQDNKGRLAKVSLSVWYEDPEPDATPATQAVSGSGGE